MLLSTRHLRRSVLRMCFTTTRELDLTGVDPAGDMTLPLPRQRHQHLPAPYAHSNAVGHARYTEDPTPTDAESIEDNGQTPAS